MRRKLTLSALLIVALCCLPAWGRQRHHTGTRPGNFDYYLFSLSWAPNYCADHPSDHSSECSPNLHTAFVVHGLWPQKVSGAPPESCAPARPVATQTVNRVTSIMPSRTLIQHEWAKHGTCSGLSADDYFSAIERSFHSLQIPEEYKSLSGEQEFDVRQIEQSFADVNHAPVGAFRVSCHANELLAVEACLTKDFQFQTCTQSVRECPARSVLMRPVP
jgi:ribonuclease T2